MAVRDMFRSLLGRQGATDEEPASILEARSHLAGVEAVLAKAEAAHARRHAELEGLEGVAAVAEERARAKSAVSSADDAAHLAAVIHGERAAAAKRERDDGRQRLAQSEQDVTTARNTVVRAKRDLELALHRHAGDMRRLVERTRPRIVAILGALDAIRTATTELVQDLAATNEARQKAGEIELDSVPVAGVLLQELLERGLAVGDEEAKAIRWALGAAGERPVFENLVHRLLGIVWPWGRITGWTPEVFARRAKLWMESPTYGDVVRLEREAQAAEERRRLAQPPQQTFRAPRNGAAYGGGKWPYPTPDPRKDGGRTMHDEAPPGKRWDPITQSYVDDIKPKTRIVHLAPGGRPMPSAYPTEGETVVTNDMLPDRGGR